MAPLFKQMTICGVGLIGGSLALSARRHFLVGRVVGLGHTRENLKVAMRRGIIDMATRDPRRAARDADLVVLAVPVRTMPSLLRAMVEELPREAVVTDVGSVKSWVMRELEPMLRPGMALVGSHPLAGKETTGAIAADADLFKGRRVIVTPSARTTPAALRKVEALWRASGARVERLTAATHDELLARASHLPQVVASALATSLAGARVRGYRATDFGAGGLRDTTRIAASSPSMWRDICLTNRAAILRALARFGAVFEEFVDLIDRGDDAGLEKLFARGRRMRERLK